MRALTWHGKHDVRVETVPDSEIVNPHDAIIEVTSTAICGSDLHLYDGVIPGLFVGDISRYMDTPCRRSSVIRILPAAIPAGRLNMCGCRSRISGPSSFPMGWMMTRSCSCQTSCRRVGWQQRTPGSRRATPSLSGAADQSAFLRYSRHW